MAPAIGRIRRRSSFRALARPDGRGSAGPLRVTYVRVTAETPGLACVGYAVGRRHGNAVARNRLRRRLRAALQEVASTRPLPPGTYLVSARPDASSLDTDALRAALETATFRAAAPHAAASQPDPSQAGDADERAGAVASQASQAGGR